MNDGAGAEGETAGFSSHAVKLRSRSNGGTPGCRRTVVTTACRNRLSCRVANWRCSARIQESH